MKNIILTKAFLFSFLFFFLTSAGAVKGTTFYVATNGSDSNPGTITQPFQTLQKGANLLNPGDILYVRGGIYQQTVTFDRSGTATAPIQILAYPSEIPIVDGDNYRLPTGDWGPFFVVRGNYVQVAGFEVRYSNWAGVIISGQHCLVSRFNSHHNKANGILVSGDYSIVEDSKVWWNCTDNANGVSTRGGWASGLSAARSPNYAVLRRNEVYYNWGEGLSTYEANGTILEDNIVYEIWAVNAYISDASNVLFQRNLIYNDGSLMSSGGRTGIAIGNEKWSNPSSNIKVINNLVLGTRRSFYWFYQYGYLQDVLIAHNTFVNSVGADIPNFQFGSGTHQNVRVENNIIEQDDSLPIAIIGTSTGLTFSHNLWSKTPPSNAVGSGDIIGDPRLAKTGSVQAGALTAEWFKLLANSPAINKAVVLSEVTNDYFGNPRGSTPDIGAHEFIGATVTPTSTPTFIPQISGDVNHDGHVNLADYTLFIPSYGTNDVNSDFNKNGTVDMGDYSLLVENYGKY